MRLLRLLFLALLSISFATTVGADCVDYTGYYPDPAPLTGGLALFGEAMDVALAGDYAYVVGEMGLQVIDVSNPSSMVIVGAVNTLAPATGVAVSGSYAYVAEDGLRVFDISDPAHPVSVAYRQTNYPAFELAVAGDFAYLAAHYRLEIFDISVPTDPIERSDISVNDLARGVAVVGDYAYVADEEAGLTVFSIGNPDAPAEVGNVDTGTANAVAVLGGYAFVADAINGLVIVDVSTPASPAVVTSLAMPVSYVNDVAVSGDLEPDYVYVANYTNDLQIVDVSTPASPVLAGQAGGAGYSYGVAIAGDIAYLCNGDNGSFASFNVIDRYAPGLLGTVATWHSVEGVGVAEIGGNVIVAMAARNNGVHVIDFSDPTAPVMLAEAGIPSDDAMEIVMDGQLAYVANGGRGVALWDLSTPSTPVLMSQEDTGGYASSLDLVGTTVYVADYGGGLVIMDASDPYDLQILGQVPTYNQAWDVIVNGDYAYVGDNNGSLTVVDVANPAAPALVTAVPMPIGTTRGVDLHDGYLYIAAYGGGLQIAELSDPALPALVASCSFDFGAWDVEWSGHFAYLALGNGGIGVVDVTDPLNPVYRGYADTPGLAARVEVAGDIVYAAVRKAGIQAALIDCDDTTPVFLSSFDLSPGAGTVDLRWELAEGGDGAEFRLEASLNGASWTLPYEQPHPGHYAARDASAALAGGGEVTYRLFASAGDGFWELLRSESVRVGPVAWATGIVGAWPNPFNPQACLRYDLAAAGTARLAIYDLAGRLVVLLSEGHHGAGRHEATWDGRDAHGREMASGVYLARLSTGTGVDTHRLVLAR